MKLNSRNIAVPNWTEILLIKCANSEVFAEFMRNIF